uniref:Uncharacterized protein n=1 Tax=Timema douglasi TaxID=61478 RepID=A0A7R8VHH4_TIMDO|nr:unnamed protein product [Timema douglasi]
MKPTAMVVSCLTTLVSKHGSHDQKGTVMGIFRSLGALARATGPIFASIGCLLGHESQGKVTNSGKGHEKVTNF